MSAKTWQQLDVTKAKCQAARRAGLDFENYTVGSWDWGTVITILVRPTLLVNLLESLENMPEVEKVEEEPVARGDFPSFHKMLRPVSRLSINTSKRIRVTMKETEMARQNS